ncbi:hypothetical protein PybrP1_012847 [[Pythium] brassicae (nom. inval.)]|nr:hypothetical protein PybrP1_012847 [[Pythium] brassicae (nom. inval.)]
MDLSPTEAIEKVLGAGMDADFEELWACVKSSVNARTEQDQWTALMVACGSPLDTSEFIRNMIAAGADVAAVDGDGWTALHWCAFHGRPEAAATVLETAPAHKVAEALEIRALDNRLAVEVARAEGHIAVEAVITKFASILETQALSDASSSSSGSSGDEEEAEEPAAEVEDDDAGSSSPAKEYNDDDRVLE